MFRESRPPAADVEGQSVIWETVWRWMLGPVASLHTPTADAHNPGADAAIAKLTARVAASHGDGGIMDAALEPSRVSAAYQLVEKGDAGAAALLALLVGQNGSAKTSEFGLRGWGPSRSAAYALAFSSSQQVVPALAAAAARTRNCAKFARLQCSVWANQSHSTLCACAGYWERFATKAVSYGLRPLLRLALLGVG